MRMSLCLTMLVAAALSIAACSEEPIEPPTEEFVTPRLGARFVYDGYIIDESGARRADTSWTITAVVSAIDSTIAGENGVAVVEEHGARYYLQRLPSGDVRVPFIDKQPRIDVVGGPHDIRSITIGGQPWEPVRGELSDPSTKSWITLPFSTRASPDLPELLSYSRDSIGFIRCSGRVRYIADEQVDIGIEVIATRHLQETTISDVQVGNVSVMKWHDTLDLWWAPSLGYLVKAERRPGNHRTSGWGHLLVGYDP